MKWARFACSAVIVGLLIVITGTFLTFEPEGETAQAYEVVHLEPGIYTARFEMPILNEPKKEGVMIGRFSKDTPVRIAGTRQVADAVFGEVGKEGSGMWVLLLDGGEENFVKED